MERAARPAHWNAVVNHHQRASQQFAIADTPRGIHYTYSMVSGASTAHRLVMLVDALQGVTERRQRHACIASPLSLPPLGRAVSQSMHGFAI
jgi:sulfate adenylyltransferase subunit 1 (EFTu-like GTPase family)